MSETTEAPPAAAEVAPSDEVQVATETETEREPVELSIRCLLESGAHFGHQTQRWNPRMRPYIFGERNGTHIIDLDQTLPLMREALDHLREIVAEGGTVLFVGTKRQAAPIVHDESVRAEQFYVNNRWLGGMLTNWKTVKKSIDRYKEIIEILDDEERRSAFSKKELARFSRLREKYHKSLHGIREMTRLPSAIFVIDVSKEQIAVSEGRRLGIPIIAVVDSNCNPDGVDFVVPGNDDAIRAIDLYCRLVADACIEGARIHNDRILAESSAAGDGQAPGVSTGRRVVEIKQAPRRGRAQQGTTSGRTQSAGGRNNPDNVPKPVAAADAPPAASKANVAQPEAPAEASSPSPEGETENSSSGVQEEE